MTLATGPRLRPLATAVLLALALATACAQQPAAKTAAEQAIEALERGVQAYNAGRTDEALVAFFETLSKDPTNKFAFSNLGLLYRRANEPIIAEGYYLQALKIDPAYAPALFGLGFFRLAVGAWAEAEDANRKVIAAEPNNASAHFNLALALRGQGREAEAQASFQRANQLDPNLVPPATPTPTATPRR